MDTSTPSSDHLQSTSVVGLDEDSNYRTPCVLAIVSLILGIVAPVALFAPLLLVIAIAGGLLALMAIRQINSSDGTLIGRTAASIGLALSVAAIAAVIARSTLTDKLLSRQAQAAAVEWFSLLQSGDVQRAFERTTASRQAPPKAPPGAPPTEAEAQASPLDTFLADPVIHFLLEHTQGKSVQYSRDAIVDMAAVSNARVQQVYEVDIPAEVGDSPSTTIELILQRTRGYANSPAEWLVAAYKSSDLPPADSHDHHAGHVH